MYIYILPVHHCSILAKSFLRTLKDNNIFTLQLSNPDSSLPSDWSYEDVSRFEEYYEDIMYIVLYPFTSSWDMDLPWILRDLHKVSNVSITMYR